ncbi:MAG: threonylcarbamoyl-AMP synthase [Spirochaetia bacterium]|nr:threonylcarbamoyl-AMP synthase [Spirochaetia bacterium]
MMEKRPAVFLDRDGTIIEDRGYITSSHEAVLYPDSIEALKQLQQRYRLFVISNQSGVAKGLISEENLEAVNTDLDSRLRSEGIRITAWYMCTHDTGDGCICRKPNPYFLLEAEKKFGIDLKRSFVIGDHPHDPETADDVGAFGLYLLTGHGMKHLQELPENRMVFHSLSDAAAWILAHPEHKQYLQKSIREGAAAVMRGGLTAFPTETVYGLGADALNPDAVKKIFAAKHRPFFDPLIVHIAEKGQLRQLIKELPEKALQLVDAFWPGPLTLVLPKSDAVPDVVTAGKSTVAVRMPLNPWARQLIQEAGTPIAAPSANLFGRTSPTTAAHVKEQLGSSCDVIIDAGACRVGVESTVLSLTGPEAVILRAGGIDKRQIEAVIGPVKAGTADNDGSRQAGSERVDISMSPGLLDSHYAPQTPLFVLDDVTEAAEDPETGVILFEEPKIEFAGPVEVISRNADLSSAATNLYAAIRRLDTMQLRRIVTHPVSDEGIGAAVNDRIRKASTKQ